jgi:hypothetical protein
VILVNFIDAIMDHLESNLDLFKTFKADILGEDDDALAIKRIPSSPNMRFMDGSRDDVVAFQVLVRNKDQLKAINTIVAISNALESLPELIIDEGQLIKCELYSLPTIVGSDRELYLYSALFNATIHKGR